jgi:hypothetical protein
MGHKGLLNSTFSVFPQGESGKVAKLFCQNRAYIYKGILSISLFMLFILGSTSSNASIFKGDATVSSAGLYYITNGNSNSVGSVWSSYTYNINYGFDVSFDVKIGNSNGNGAEGYSIIFLKRNTVPLGTGGGGLGVQGIDTSLIVEFDTRGSGTTYNDPSGNGTDHIALRKNGRFDSTNNISGNISVGNLEDGAYHNLRIRWIYGTKYFEVYVDSVRKMNVYIDMINDIFYGQNNIYWGVSGAGSNGNSEVIMKNFSSPLPVSLTSFVAAKEGNSNVLNWSTASEYNADRFEIYRSEDGDAWSLAGTVPCAGTSTTVKNYSFVDAAAYNYKGKLYYMLRQVDLDGNDEYFNIISIDGEIEAIDAKHHFYDMDGHHIYYGTIVEFLTECEPGKIYIADNNKKYMRN